MISLNLLSRVLGAETLAALADDDADGLADAGVLEAAAQAAEEEVRLRLRGTDAEPGAELSPLLEDLVTTLAVERLFERRRDLVPGPWTERAVRARVLLRDLAEGRLGAARPRVEAPDGPPPLHRHCHLYPC